MGEVLIFHWNVTENERWRHKYVIVMTLSKLFVLLDKIYNVVLTLPNLIKGDMKSVSWSIVVINVNVLQYVLRQITPFTLR